MATSCHSFPSFHIPQHVPPNSSPSSHRRLVRLNPMSLALPFPFLSTLCLGRPIHKGSTVLREAVGIARLLACLRFASREVDDGGDILSISFTHLRPRSRLTFSPLVVLESNPYLPLLISMRSVIISSQFPSLSHSPESQQIDSPPLQLHYIP